MRGVFSLPVFRDLCHAHGLAVTHQRQVIYQSLLGMRNHPSPEAVYERVRRVIPSISLGTVYKTIHAFLEAGVIREVSIHHGALRIEANREPHYHLICSECKSVTDLDKTQVEPIRVKGGLPNGFEARRFALDIIGLCEACRARNDGPDPPGRGWRSKWKRQRVKARERVEEPIERILADGPHFPQSMVKGSRRRRSNGAFIDINSNIHNKQGETPWRR